MIDYGFAEHAAREIDAAVQQYKELLCLWTDLRAAAIRYAHLRSEWMVSGIDARVTIDRERTQAHDAFISTCDALSRNMAERNQTIERRKQLGAANTVSGRKSVGDFACFLTCVIAISAR